MFDNKKLGFTLAEVLVILGLIGAIAALTIPNLAYNYKAKVLEEQFRSTYSDVAQIGAMINTEKGDVGRFALNSSLTDWAQDFVSRLNGGNKLFDISSPQDLQDKYTAYYSQAGASPGPYAFNVDGSGQRIKVGNICDNTSVWLDSKGRLWSFNSEGRTVCVDINGTANPNRLNIDIFAFLPMPAEYVATWVYNDRTHPTDYTAQMVLCDIDKLTRKSLSNTQPTVDEDGYYTAHKDDPKSMYDTCPFTEPIENIAPINGFVPGKNARNKDVTNSDTYWKTYINYK